MTVAKNIIFSEVNRAKMSDELVRLSRQIADLQEKMAYQEDGHSQLEKEIVIEVFASSSILIKS